MVLQEQWLENEAKLINVRNQTYTYNLPLCMCICVCIYKLSNPEHTECYDRFSIVIVFCFFPQALANGITFGSEMNYSTQYMNSWMKCNGLLFYRKPDWLKQQTGTISKSIRNNYSKSQSQPKYVVSTNACGSHILH